MRKHTLLFSLVILWFFFPANSFALNSADDVLVAKYRQLESTIKPEEAVKAHQKLMETSTKLLELSSATLTAMQQLEEYSETVVNTGVLFSQPLNEIEKFQKKMGAINNHPALKGFDKFMSVSSNYDDITSLVSDFSSTLNNEDLPPSAKKTLTALQLVGKSFSKMGNIPVIGAALEGYGEIIGGLAKTMNGLANNATHLKQAGLFSVTDEVEMLKGLNRSQEYAKTPLWSYGIPLVRLWRYGGGKEVYYLKDSTNYDDDGWSEVDYEKAASIAADYQIQYGKSIDHSTVLKYLYDGEARSVLRASAETEIERRRIQKTFEGIEGQGGRTVYNSQKERVIKWHAALRLPLTYKMLTFYIRNNYETPGYLSRALRARAINAYPEFKKYLSYLEVDKDKTSMLQFIDLFTQYKDGQHLIADIQVDVLDNEGNPLDDAIVILEGPKGTIKKSPKSGRVLVEKLPIGNYKITIKAKGFEDKRYSRFFLEPMSHKKGQAKLNKEVKENPPEPPKKKEAPKPRAKPDPPTEYVPQKKTDLPEPTRPEPAKPNRNEACVKKWTEIAARAQASNASNDPSGNMGTVMLGAPECAAAYDQCQDKGIKAGNACRSQPHPGMDPVAVNKKCNTVVGTIWIECAQQEVNCSLPYLLKKCQ